MGQVRAEAKDPLLDRKKQVCGAVSDYIKSYAAIIPDFGMMHWEIKTTQLNLKQFADAHSSKSHDPSEYLVWRNVGLAIQHFKSDAVERAVPVPENPHREAFSQLISSDKFKNLETALDNVRLLEETFFPFYLHHQLKKSIEKMPETPGAKKLLTDIRSLANDNHKDSKEKVEAITQTIKSFTEPSKGFSIFKPSSIKTTLTHCLEKETQAMTSTLPLAHK